MYISRRARVYARTRGYGRLSILLFGSFDIRGEGFSGREARKRMTLLSCPRARKQYVGHERRYLGD